MTATPRTIRDALHDALNTERPHAELEAWLAPTPDGFGGEVPLFVAAAAYVNARRLDLVAVCGGFTKAGTSIVKLIEVLKARAAGPPEPEIHEFADHRICVYLWRTGTGPKLIAFQRAEPIDGYAPDWWRQLKILNLGERSYMLGDVIRWDAPGKGASVGDGKPVVYDVAERARTPCTDEKCPAEFLIDCACTALEESLGFRFPDTEDLNTAAPVIDPEVPLVDAVTTRAAARDLQVRHAANEPATCRRRDAHLGPCGAPDCAWLEAESIRDADPTPGVPLDPSAEDDIRANPDWSPVGTGTEPIEQGPGSESGLPTADPVASATGDDNETSGQEAATRNAIDSWEQDLDGDTVADDPEPVVHCPGAWVPPGTNPFACHPVPTESNVTFKWRIDSGESDLRAQLPGVTCSTCRQVMNAIMEAGRWAGPNLTPTSMKGWIEDECPHRHVGPAYDACPCPPSCGCHPCPGAEAPDHGQSYTHRCVTEKCDVTIWRAPKLALTCTTCKKPCEVWDTADDAYHGDKITPDLEARGAELREATERSRRVREDLALGAACARCNKPTTDDDRIARDEKTVFHIDCWRAQVESEGNVEINPDATPPGATFTEDEIPMSTPEGGDEYSDDAEGTDEPPEGSTLHMRAVAVPSANGVSVCGRGQLLVAPGSGADGVTCSVCLEGSAAELQARVAAPTPEAGGPEPTGCACGCTKEQHQKPPGSTRCSGCPCVRYRPGLQARAVETQGDTDAYRADQRRAWVLSLDMAKVRFQATSKKAYRACELCRGMVKGPEKNEKGKITKRGDEWVSPKGRNTRRAHLSCADEALGEITAAATA